MIIGDILGLAFKTLKFRLLSIFFVSVLGMLALFTNQYFYNYELKHYNSSLEKILKLDAFMLQMRRSEKDFLARKSDKYLNRFNDKEEKFEEVLFSLENDLNALNLSTETNNDFRKNVKAYRKGFLEIVNEHKRLGYDENRGYQKDLREAAHKLENEILGASVDEQSFINGLENIKGKEGEKIFLLLQIRRAEKDYLQRLNIKYILKNKLYCSKLLTRLNEHEKPQLLAYAKAFENIVRSTKNIGLNENDGLMGDMREKIHKVEADLSAFEQRLIPLIEKKQADAKNISLVIMFVVGLILLFFILGSMNSLVNAIKKFIELFKASKDNTKEIDVQSLPYSEFKEMGENFNTLIHLRDESEEKLKENFHILEKAQAQLIETEKMAGLGSLVSGVAHEINTPVGISLTGITYIQSELIRLQKHYNEKTLTEEHFKDFFEDTAKMADSMHLSLQKAAEVIRSFKQVAVDQHSDMKRRFNIKEYVDDVILSLHNHLKHTKLQLSNDIDENLIVDMDAGAFSHIFTNFIQNSLVHGYEQDDEGEIHIIGHMNKEILELEYIDNGKGMNEATLKKMFDPFFTTRRGTGGSGLGLSIVYNLVTSKLNGSIKCESKEGEGVHIFISIPIGAMNE